MGWGPAVDVGDAGEREGDQSASSFGLGKREFLAKLNLKQLLNYRRQFRSHQLHALSFSLSLSVFVRVCCGERAHRTPSAATRRHFLFRLQRKKYQRYKKFIVRCGRTFKKFMKKEKKNQHCLIWHNRAIAVHACTCVCVQEYSHTQARTHTHTYCTLNLGSFSFVCLN